MSLVLDFWWHFLWRFKARVGSALFAFCRGECNVHSLRSTSSATLADLLAAGTQPVLSPHTVAEVRLLGFELVLSEYLWVRRSTNWAKPGPTGFYTYRELISPAVVHMYIGFEHVEVEAGSEKAPVPEPIGSPEMSTVRNLWEK